MQIRFGEKVYNVSESVLQELYAMALESGRQVLEKGADFCAGVGEPPNGIRISSIGRKCTGSSCAVTLSDCGQSPKIGSFHTHPLGLVVGKSEPSWGDLYVMLYENKYEELPGFGCRAGISAGGVKPMQCDHVKQTMTDEEMDKLADLWGSEGHKGEKSFPFPRERHFHDPVTVEWPEAVKAAFLEEPHLIDECQAYNDSAERLGHEAERIYLTYIKKKPSPETCRVLEDIKAEGTRIANDAIKTRDTAKSDAARYECDDAIRSADLAASKASLAHQKLCAAVPEKPRMTVRDCDYTYLLTELKQMAKDAGISPTGTKTELCRKLINAAIL